MKILESADNEADDDTWGKVEKPQKKAPNRDEKVNFCFFLQIKRIFVFNEYFILIGYPIKNKYFNV